MGNLKGCGLCKQGSLLGCCVNMQAVAGLKLLGSTKKSEDAVGLSIEEYEGEFFGSFSLE